MNSQNDRDYDCRTENEVDNPKINRLNQLKSCKHVLQQNNANMCE